MPSMRSIGFTDSRMMASSLSMSFMRMADRRASGVSMFCASFMSRVPSASTSSRMRVARDLILSASASASASARTAAPRSAAAAFSAPAATVSRNASRSASCWATISSTLLRRCAISVSRAVKTCSSAVTASARALSASACATDCARDCSATATARSCSASSIALRRAISSSSTSRSLDMRCSSTARSEAMRACSIDWRDVIWARSASWSLSARSRAISARWAARWVSRSCSWASRACSSARSISSACRSVSRFLLRISIIVSCSMSLRIFLRRSICSVSRVRPSASKALDGLKYSMAVWSSWVSDTVSSSRPFCSRSAATTVRTRLHIFAALLVHLLHRHLGRHGAQRIDELAFDQLAQRIRLHGALAERLGGRGDGVVRGLHADIELAQHVDAHAIARDQRLVAAARDLQPQRVHVDRDDLVHDGQHEGAAVHHHLLAGEAGAHEGALLGGAQVKPVEQPDDDRHDDGDDDQS